MFGEGKRTKFNMVRFAHLQVCLDGHRPSFASQTAKRCPNACGVGKLLRANHTDQTKDGTLLRTAFCLVRVKGLEPSPRNPD